MTHEIPWEEAQRICDLPSVDEMIRNLIADSTNDNAVCLVREIIKQGGCATSKEASAPKYRHSSDGRTVTLLNPEDIPMYSSKEASDAAQEPELICEHCGANRFKETCRQSPCKMIGTAYAAQAAQPVADAQPCRDDVIEDLRLLVVRLVRQLEKVDPGKDLGPQALDYLRRKGLNGTPLRTQPAEPVQAVTLTPAKIEKGWRDTFSTNNPFCPCDLGAFTKAVKWAEHRLLAGGTKIGDANGSM